MRVTAAKDGVLIRRRLRIFAAAIALVLLCAVCIGGVSGADVWDGTADTSWYKDNQDTFTITTAEQLAGLARLVNNGNNFVGKTINLGDDIILNSDINADNLNKWTLIGSSERNSFAGTFDGNGYTISGLYQRLNWYDGSGSLGGLFGYVSGMITGVYLADSKIVINKGGVTIGSLVAVLNGGNVNNCIVDSSVSISSWSFGGAVSQWIGRPYMVGGVVGQNSNGIVSSSDIYADVDEFFWSADESKNQHYGDIVGYGGEKNAEVYYTITPTCSVGGTIDPSKETDYLKGETHSYTFTPDNGYVVKQVLVDGKDATNDPHLSTDTYTFEDIKADHTIHVEFEEGISYTITIPDELIIYEDKAGEMDITPTHLWIPDTSSLSVRVKSDNSFHLIYGYDSSIDLEYALKNGNTVIPNNGVAATFTMANKDAVSLSAELTGNEIRYAGEYADKLTFTVEVVKGTA